MSTLIAPAQPVGANLVQSVVANEIGRPITAADYVEKPAARCLVTKAAEYRRELRILDHLPTWNDADFYQIGTSIIAVATQKSTARAEFARDPDSDYSYMVYFMCCGLTNHANRSKIRIEGIRMGCLHFIDPAGFDLVKSDHSHMYDFGPEWVLAGLSNGILPIVHNCNHPLAYY